ncbi:MAG: PDZ domain-containing protein [Ardenticatenia bacterium]|nr:PDZ domain-containing protein [Ardenticatenia bacterium]
MTSRPNRTCCLQTVALVLVTGLLMAGAFSAGWLGYGYIFNALGMAPPVRAAEDKRDDVDLAVFWEAVNLLRENFYGEVPEGDALTYAAVRGLVLALNDPFTSFADPEMTRFFSEDLQGEIEGIGAMVRMNEQGELVIVTPIPGTPAEAAGLQAGDIVVAVDGQRIQGMTLFEAVSLIRGPKGTTVRLSIRRGAEEPFDVEIVRARIEIPTVSSRLIEEPGKPKLGYLKLNDFNAKATDQVKQELERFRQEGVEGLIFDLRNNPGGLLGGLHRGDQPVHRETASGPHRAGQAGRASIPHQRRGPLARPPHGGADQRGERQCQRDRSRRHSRLRSGPPGGDDHLWQGEHSEPVHPPGWFQLAGDHGPLDWFSTQRSRFHSRGSSVATLPSGPGE